MEKEKKLESLIENTFKVLLLLLLLRLAGLQDLPHIRLWLSFSDFTSGWQVMGTHCTLSDFLEVLLFTLRCPFCELPRLKGQQRALQ